MANHGGAGSPPRWFTILGPVTVALAGTTRTITGARRRALLARLLISAGEVVARDTLIEDLWGDKPPANPINALQAYLSHLRQVVEAEPPGSGAPGVLLTRKPGYVLQLDPSELDAKRFEGLVSRAREKLDRDPPAAGKALSEALDLWTGPALAEFRTEPWALAEVARLEELRASAIEDLFEVELAMGNHTGVIASIEASCAESPLRERRRGQLLLALYRSGRQPEALRGYQVFRETLGEELGLEPGPELKRLEQRIAVQDPSLDWSPPQAHQTGVQLPVPATSFIGREDDLVRIPELLARERLVTVTGLGGGGKTRLALQVAAGLIDRFPDGIWLVELAPVPADDGVADAVAAAVGVRPGRGAVAEHALADWLRDRSALLLLDNCEHVLAGVERTVALLLQRAPGVRVLATSREPLRLPGAVAVTLRSLRTPPEGDEAVRLFTDRAAAAAAGWTPAEDDEEHVVEICRRLEGHPLAIELAAGAVATMPVQEVLRHIENQHVVISGGSSINPRHQSLEAALGWGIERMATEHRRLLGQLASFAGRFSLSAAEDLAGARDVEASATVAAGVAALTRASLVVFDSAAGRHPYRLPEPVRVYALRHMSGDPGASVREAHLEWVARLAATAEAKLAGSEQGRMLADLDAWTDDIRSALRFAIEDHHAPRLGLDIAVGLTRWWSIRGRATEGREWVEAALQSLSGSDLPVVRRKTALRTLSVLALDEGRLAESASRAEELLELGRSVGDEWAVTSALLALGQVAVTRSEFTAADQYLDEALSNAQALDDSALVAGILLARATADRLRGDYREAGERYEKGLAAARSIGDVRVLATALNHRAALRQVTGDWDGAEEDLEEGLTAARSLGFRQAEATGLGNLGTIRALRGDMAEAARLLEESVERARQIGDQRVLFSSLANLGAAEQQEGRLDAARRHMGEALLMARRVGEPRVVAQVLTNLADIALAGADVEAGRDLLRDALVICRRVGNRRAVVEGLEGAAAVLVAQNRHGEAARLLGAAARHHEVLNLPLEPAQAKAVRLTTEQCRSALGQAFDDEFAAGAVVDLAAAADEALAALGEPQGTTAVQLHPPGDAVAIRLLGGFRAWRGGGEIVWQDVLGADAADLLALLAVQRGRPITREAALGALWDDAAQGRDRLSRTIAVLRAALDPDRRHDPAWFVAADAGGVRLDLSHVEVDTERVLAAADRGLALHRQGDHAGAVAHLLTAVTGSDGDVLADRPFASWALPLRSQVRGAVTDAARALAAIARQQDDPSNAVTFARMVVERDRFDEDAHLALIEALGASGRYDEVHAARADYAAVMAQLGLRPASAPVGAEA